MILSCSWVMLTSFETPKVHISGFGCYNVVFTTCGALCQISFVMTNFFSLCSIIGCLRSCSVTRLKAGWLTLMDRPPLSLKNLARNTALQFHSGNGKSVCLVLVFHLHNTNHSKKSSPINHFIVFILGGDSKVMTACLSRYDSFERGLISSKHLKTNQEVLSPSQTHSIKVKQSMC